MLIQRLRPSPQVSVAVFLRGTVAPALALGSERWIEAERGRFAPWLAVSMVAGALLYFALVSEPPWWWPMTALVAGIAIVAAGWRSQIARAAGLVLIAAALGFGSALMAAGRVSPMEALPSRAVMLQATVRTVEALPDGRRVELESVRLNPDETPFQRMIRVRLKPGDETQVTSGDHVALRALLRSPGSPTYPGGWDQQRDAWFNGLGGSGMALGAVQVTEHAQPQGLGPRIQALRDSIAAHTLAALPGPQGAIATTLLTGAPRAIPESDRAAFRDSGLAHLLAVAGLHIGIVMGLFMVTARLMLVAWPYAALHWPTKAIAAATALIAGLLYLLLTGAHIPILRSFAMAALVTLAVVTGRRALSMRGLMLAAAALVLVVPQAVVGVGFQMSFAAVIALIAGYEAMRPLLARLHGPGWRRVALHVAMLLLTSLLAGTASAPYGAYHFGHVQLYYVIANVIAVPLTAFWVLPLGVLALFLMPFGLDQIAFMPMGWGLGALLWIARTVASWPAATLPAPAMPGWGLALFSLGLAWLCLWRTRVRLAGAAIMAAGLLSPLTTPLPDVLVSSDARLIAWRTEGRYALLAGPGASWFVRGAWQQRLGVEVWRPLNEGCDEDTCRQGGVLLLRNRQARPDCAGVQIVISPDPASGVCPNAALVDRFTVWRDGAHAVWLHDGVPVVLSDRMDRGARPWVPPPPLPRRRPSNLPMAPIEVLPAPTED